MPSVPSSRSACGAPRVFLASAPGCPRRTPARSHRLRLAPRARPPRVYGDPVTPMFSPQSHVSGLGILNGCPFFFEADYRPPLENNLQRKLENPRVGCARNHAERRSAHGVAWTGKINVVERIEEFRTKLGRHALDDRDRFN